MNTALSKDLKKGARKPEAKVPKQPKWDQGKCSQCHTVQVLLLIPWGGRTYCVVVTSIGAAKSEDSGDQRALTAQHASPFLGRSPWVFLWGTPSVPVLRQDPSALDGGHICQSENSSWHGHGLTSRPVMTGLLLELLSTELSFLFQLGCQAYRMYIALRLL